MYVYQSMDDNKELISSGESRDLGESGTKLLLLKMNGTINNNGTVIVVSPSVTVETSSSASSVDHAGNNSNNKRQGLRKWKRIPRQLAMKTGSSFNNNNKENGESNVLPRNVSPVCEMVLNGNGDGDSDLSSRSSTAASPPRSRIGSGKKARGFNMQKEESLNSAVVFVQGSNSLASRSRQSEPSAKCDEESSDDKDLNEQVAFVKSDVESDDALVESIKALHFAQQEFEKEVLKWRDVGKDDSLYVNDPLREILELKDARILELELALSSDGFKTEMEDCLMKMIQADVENVVITATTRRLIEGPLREVKHKLQENNVLSEDVQTKKQDDKLETKESVKKLQSRVCRFTLCFVIQFILLFVTLYLKSSPQIVEIVPT